MQQRSLSAVVDGFVPARLTIARNARGMKQNELATAIKRAPATISKWESGIYDQSPDNVTVAGLADILSVEVTWFYKPLVSDNNVAFFRSLKSELFLARDKTSAKLHFVDEIFKALTERVEFPQTDIPDILDGIDYKTLTPEIIDRLANELRDYWGLGDDPIDDLMLIIENAGVAVSEDYVDSTRLDGVSRWFEDRPVVLLAKDKDGGVRRRFDAAHELGHLVLHQAVREEDLKRDLTIIEEQAMAFAGAFLLPGASFSSDISDVTLDILADIKPKWKVSIGAMIKRLKMLNLVTDDHERNLWKYYSYRRWRGNEPYDDRIEVERPLNMKSAIEMIAEDGPEELRSLVSDIGLSQEDISDLTGIDPVLLMPNRRIKPKLKIIQREGSMENSLKAAND